MRAMRNGAWVLMVAVMLLAGCQEGRNHEMRQQPANVDTLVFDEAYYERMWLFEAVGAGDVELDK